MTVVTVFGRSIFFSSYPAYLKTYFTVQVNIERIMKIFFRSDERTAGLTIQICLSLQGEKHIIVVSSTARVATRLEKWD